MSEVSAGIAEPSRDAIEVWILPLEDLAGPLRSLDAATGLLSDQERAEALSGSGLGRNAHRLTARLALRLLIGRAFGPPFAHQSFIAGPHGKPSLAGLDGDFNVAHSGGTAVIGLGRVARIGVDVEEARVLKMSPVRIEALTGAARHVAPDAPLPEGADRAALQAWVRLEALAKADGLGIGRTLTRLGVWGSGHGRPPEGPGAGLDLSVFDLLTGPQVFAAVALPRGVPVPDLRVLPQSADALATLAAHRGAGGEFRR